MKAPPNDLRAERVIIKSMINHEDALLYGLEQLTGEEFYNLGLRTLHTSLKSIETGRGVVDIVSVFDWLKTANVPGTEQAEKELIEITDHLDSRNIKSSVDIVKKCYRLRSVISACGNSYNLAYDIKNDPYEIVTDCMGTISKAIDGNSEKTYAPVKKILPEVFETLEKTSKGEVTGILTGIGGLDRKLLGLERTDLIIWAGRPGMGKTASALQVALNTAKAGYKVLFASLEMSKSQLVRRMLSNEARVTVSEMKQKDKAKRILNQLGTSAGVIYELPIYIDDEPSSKASDIFMKATRVKKLMGGLDLLILDYIQLMGDDEKHDTRNNAVGYNSKMLKKLAMNFNMPVIALSQLNRDVEKRGKSVEDKIPMLSDLRESGSLEQDANVVVFPYRPYVYDQSDESLKNKFIWAVAKNREGETGLGYSHCEIEYSRFYDIDNNLQENVSHYANENF